MSSLRKRKAPTDSSAADPHATVQTPPKPSRTRRPRQPPQDIGISQLLLGAGRVPLADSALAVRGAGGTFARERLTPELLQKACDYLAAKDERLAPLIAQHGPPECLLAKEGDAFATLSKSICFQQLATQAAAKIFGRVLVACQCAECGLLSPGAVISTPHEALCGAGLSRMKASYLHDLARHFSEGLLSNEAISTMNGAVLHKALTAVKGLGPWSVDMFSLFHLGLPDVLPLGDLGVRRGMQALYGLKELPSPVKMEAVAGRWYPWRSVGSYFMWRVETPRTQGKKP